MIELIKTLILKFRCRKIYMQLPELVKMQLFLEMCQPQNKDCSYADILKRELELMGESNAEQCK